MLSVTSYPVQKSLCYIHCRYRKESRSPPSGLSPTETEKDKERDEKDQFEGQKSLLQATIMKGEIRDISIEFRGFVLAMNQFY